MTRPELTAVLGHLEPGSPVAFKAAYCWGWLAHLLRAELLPEAWLAPQAVREQRALSLRTLHRRVGEVACWRRPRQVAKGDPDHDQTLAVLHQQLTGLPDGAVVLAEDETDISPLLWVRLTWIAQGLPPAGDVPGHQPTPQHLRRRRPCHRPFLYQVARKAVSATFTAFAPSRLRPTRRHPRSWWSGIMRASTTASSCSAD